MKFVSSHLACAVLLWLFSAGVNAEEAMPPNAQQQAITGAIELVRQTLQPGPRVIPLAGQANLKLPQGYGFVPTAAAAAYLKALGNVPGPTLAGLVIPLSDPPRDWFVVVQYEASGHILDDDAREWKADELLASLREGTEADNAARREQGVPELDIKGWVEPPRYDAATHRLVWSMAVVTRGVDEADPGINYNTYALGREGYFSLNLVSAQSQIAHDKNDAATLLAALEFDAGRRYADYQPDSDKTAEYGLAALVAGAAAKKLGLLAAVGVFLLKFWKIALAAVFGAGYWARKRVKGKQNESLKPPEPPQ